MEPPRVNPIGILETPSDLATTPRRFSRPRRLLAGLLLAIFFLATVVTTVASFGRYCLTTDAADTRALPSQGRR
ncbi:MAG TPA: hypothetical protein VLV54_19375 [Thermoanaerobaculia bacterium]|nr:hypothetical protein [Thermoanaerobaculia bacterium]